MKRIPKVPSKEDILQYYIKENHYRADTAAHFGMSDSQLGRYLNEYGIHKPEELRMELVKKSAPPTDFSKPPFPPKQDVIRYYIDELHSIPETMEYFHMGKSVLVRYLAFHGIAKSREETQKTTERLNMERYGVKYYKDPASVEKAKRTSMERYGYENPSYSPEIIQKIKDSESKPRPPEGELRDLYINQKMSQPALGQHYGVSVELVRKWLHSYNIKKTTEQVVAARQQTCRAIYGVDNATQSLVVRKKMKATTFEHYGVYNVASANIHHLDSWQDRDLFIAALSEIGPKPSVIEIARYFNVCGSRATDRIHEFGVEELTDFQPLVSEYEKELIRFCKEDLGIENIEQSNRSILDGFELDIYFPDYKFAIEFNGEYWHSEKNPKYADHGGRSVKHQQKSLLAEEKGVFIFHIFEHEWSERYISVNPKFQNSRENIKNRLKSMLGIDIKRIPARKCEIREIDKRTKTEFMNLYHIQGADHRSVFAYGLFFNGELVACMSFCRSKFEKYTWELSRFCVKHGLAIQGGASKLFSHFLKEKANSGDRIVSYNDITKTKGDVYKALGFSCESIGSPNYWWVNLNTYDVRSRYLEQAAGEVQRMHEQGYVRICDCGTRTWVYTKP